LARQKALGRIADILKRKFTIISNLYTNSLQLASASEEGGADAIELNLNFEETGTGVRYGTIDLEEHAISEIIGSVKVPVGVRIGDAPMIRREEWEKIVSTGIDYVKMMAHHMPSFIYNDERVCKIISVGSGYVLEQVEILAHDGRVSGIEAAIISPQVFRLPLTLLDITTYALITRRASKPVIVPSQKYIEPNDLRILKKIGVEGLVINYTIIGTNPLGYAEILQEYKRVADEL
jgi:hypothetical protein